MHAYIVTGSDKKGRDLYISTQLASYALSPFDVVSLAPPQDQAHITIAQIREFTTRLQLAPQSSSYSAGIIQEAHTMTIEAQNALLKTLEEPPPHALLFLETANAHALLATIRSRCLIQAIKPGKNDTQPQNSPQALLAPLEGTMGESLAYLSTLAPNRERAKQFVSDGLAALHALLLQSTSTQTDIPLPRIIFLAKKFQAAHRDLEANIHPQMAIDMITIL